MFGTVGIYEALSGSKEKVLVEKPHSVEDIYLMGENEFLVHVKMGWYVDGDELWDWSDDKMVRLYKEDIPEGRVFSHGDFLNAVENYITQREKVE